MRKISDHKPQKNSYGNPWNELQKSIIGIVQSLCDRFTGDHKEKYPNQNEEDGRKQYQQSDRFEVIPQYLCLEANIFHIPFRNLISGFPLHLPAEFQDQT
jgi:hypothetical protein